ncbi:hypothetical protein HDU96_009733 [Phlyctochytrium bullatum]|nr:hypothetical protein HDU96_009733 [Phlyctochytrium bullatum]
MQHQLAPSSSGSYSNHQNRMYSSNHPHQQQNAYSNNNHYFAQPVSPLSPHSQYHQDNQTLVLNRLNSVDSGVSMSFTASAPGGTGMHMMPPRRTLSNQPPPPIPLPPTPDSMATAGQDPNILHSLQELHDTLLGLVENGMRRDQRTLATPPPMARATRSPVSPSRPTANLSPAAAYAIQKQQEQFEKKAAMARQPSPLPPPQQTKQPTPEPDGADAYSYYDSILDEIDSSITEMDKLQKEKDFVAASSLPSPPPVDPRLGDAAARAHALFPPRGNTPPSPLTASSVATGYSMHPNLAPPSVLVSATAAAAPIDPTPVTPKAALAASAYNPNPAPAPSAVVEPPPTLESLTATEGTYFGQIEHLQQQMQPAQFVPRFIVVAGSNVHLFPSEHHPGSLPLETLRINPRACNVSLSSAGGIVTISTTSLTGVTTTWILRALSEDEGEAWAAILNASIQLAKAHEAVLRLNNPGQQQHPPASAAPRAAGQQPPPPYAPAAPVAPIVAPAATGLRRAISDESLKAAALIAGSSSSNPAAASTSGPSQPYLLSIPARNDSRRPPPLGATAAAPTNPAAARVVASYFNDPISPLTATHPHLHPTAGSARRNSVASSTGLEARNATAGVFRSTASRDDGGSSVGSGSDKPKAFNIKKILNISSGGAAGTGQQHVYLVRGGARQPKVTLASALQKGAGAEYTVVAPGQPRPSIDAASVHTASSGGSKNGVVLNAIPAGAAASVKSGGSSDATAAAAAAAAQVVVLAQAPQVKVADPEAPKKQARVFMVRGGAQFRQAPNANRLVTVTVAQNPKAAEAAEEEAAPRASFGTERSGGSDSAPPTVSVKSEGKGGLWKMGGKEKGEKKEKEKVFMVRGGVRR